MTILPVIEKVVCAVALTCAALAAPAANAASLAPLGIYQEGAKSTCSATKFCSVAFPGPTSDRTIRLSDVSCAVSYPNASTYMTGTLFDTGVVNQWYFPFTSAGTKETQALRHFHERVDAFVNRDLGFIVRTGEAGTITVQCTLVGVLIARQ